jgi:uncharacterized membrane protein YeaQ/YmgE (transglycosylase-associated protein family)
MSIIGWLIIGAVAGWLASMIMGRNEEMNWIENIVVGIVGALLGGFVFAILTDRNWDSSFDIGTLLVAIVGAVVVLAIWNAIRGRGRSLA